MLKSIDCRIEKILGKKRPSTLNEICKHVVLLVKKCMLGDTNERLLLITSHLKCMTKPQGIMGLCIPKVKLKLTKSGFFSMGVKLFYTLPNEI